MLPPLPLLEALREDPRSDDLQAIYADWLEDQQSPQADLVRLGLELARLRRTTPDPSDPGYSAHRLHYQAIDEQLRASRVKNQAIWLGKFAAVGSEWGYDGGVLTHVALPLAAFREHGAELLRLHPICSVRVSDAAGQMAGLHPLEHLRDIRRLSFRGQKIGTDGMAELGRCPQVERLVTLDLYSNGLDTTALLALTPSPNLPHLQELILAHNPLDDEGGLALAEAPHWPELSQLKLRGTAIGVRGLLALARSQRRHALRCVEAWVPGIEPARAEARELHARFGRVC
jgi:uncharacterized protein (TIGR02996 family)